MNRGMTVQLQAPRQGRHSPGSGGAGDSTSGPAPGPLVLGDGAAAATTTQLTKRVMAEPGPAPLQPAAASRRPLRRCS